MLESDDDDWFVPIVMCENGRHILAADDADDPCPYCMQCFECPCCRPHCYIEDNGCPKLRSLLRRQAKVVVDRVDNDPPSFQCKCVCGRKKCRVRISHCSFWGQVLGF